MPAVVSAPGHSRRQRDVPWAPPSVSPPFPIAYPSDETLQGGSSPEKALRVHLVGILQGMYFFPYTPEAGGIHGRFADHAQAIVHLPGGAAGFAVDVQGVACKVAHHEVEDLVEQVVADFIDPDILQDELAVDHQGKDLAQGQQEVNVLLLGV